MKTYILRPDRTVQRQSRLGAQAPAPALFIGLDVHTESIAVSHAAADGSEVRRYGLVGGTHYDVLRLAKKLQAAHP